MNNTIYLVKLGGSLITNKSKPYTARVDVIRRLAYEVKEALSERKVKLIIGHGGGSFPHTSASKYQTHKGFIDSSSRYGMAVVHYDAIRLNEIVVGEFIKAGLPVFPIQPSSIVLAEDSEIKEMHMNPILELLDRDMIPILYGDVCVDLKIGCSIISTEKILGYIALKLKELCGLKPYIIMCGIVDGVYTKDPVKYRDATFISEISKENINEVKRYLSNSYGVDVTGGMLHKVLTLYKLAEKGINSIIINCMHPDNLKNALLEGYVKGTRIKYV